MSPLHAWLDTVLLTVIVLLEIKSLHYDHRIYLSFIGDLEERRKWREMARKARKKDSSQNEQQPPSQSS